jgi:hypothetical protein
MTTTTLVDIFVSPRSAGSIVLRGIATTTNGRCVEVTKDQSVAGADWSVVRSVRGRGRGRDAAFELAQALR